MQNACQVADNFEFHFQISFIDARKKLLKLTFINFFKNIRNEIITHRKTVFYFHFPRKSSLCSEVLLFR